MTNTQYTSLQQFVRSSHSILLRHFALQYCLLYNNSQFSDNFDSSPTIFIHQIVPGISHGIQMQLYLVDASTIRAAIYGIGAAQVTTMSKAAIFPRFVLIVASLQIYSTITYLFMVLLGHFSCLITHIFRDMT